MKQTVLPTVLFIAGIAQLGAATIPYSNDFSGTGGNTAFTTETADAEWTVAGGVYQFSYTNTGYVASTASFQVTNAAGKDFTMQTQFTVTSAGNVNSNGGTIGFGLFGGNGTFSGTGTSSAYYLADFQYANSGTPGSLRILSLGDSNGFTSSATSVDDNLSSSTLALQTNTTYTLKLVGTYAGSTLSMTLGLFNAAGTAQIGTSATATDTSVLAGTNFGFRNRIGLGGGTASVNFDNFSITTTAIPEPASAALMMGCVSVLAVFAGKRSRGSSSGYRRDV